MTAPVEKAHAAAMQAGGRAAARELIAEYEADNGQFMTDAGLLDEQ